jgi:uncharacterized membrane protein YdjX (TVP38/TMEM64 family)
MTIFLPKERAFRFLTRLWTLFILVAIVFLVLNPKFLSPEYLKSILTGYGNYLWPTYIFILLARVPLVFPPTPVLFLGFLLFPNLKVLIVLLVLLSTLLSAAFFYFFAGHSGLSEYFNRNYPKQTAKIELMLSKPRAVWFVVIWSLTPIAPIDLLCVIAAVVRLPFRYLIIGMIIGQLPILFAYAYLGHLFFL